jgi:hypothetical protein
MLCLCCVPYFVAAGKDVVHCCGRCGELLARWRPGRGTVVGVVWEGATESTVRGGVERSSPKRGGSPVKVEEEEEGDWIRKVG